MPPSMELDYVNAQVTVLQPPIHGSLSNDLSPGHEIIYRPTSGYAGNDKAVFLVNVDGYKVKVVYFIKVGASYNFDTSPDRYQKYCPTPNWWRIDR